MYIDYLNVEKFGIFKIVANNDFLISVNLTTNIKTTNPNQITNQAKNQLINYFNKKLTNFDLPLNLSTLSPFTQKTLNGLLNVQYAQTISYKELAIIIGNKKAFRAVGSALGKNPYIIILPCHRIIKSNNDTGNYTCIDKSLKQKLIDFEKSIN